MPLELDNLRNSIKALTDLLAVSEDSDRMGQLSEVERNGIQSDVIQNIRDHLRALMETDGTLV